MGNNRGFTISELLIAMAIFIVIMLISSAAFEHIIATTGQQAKSIESNIEGIVGLEMVRYDIEHAGFGLPWGIQTGPGAIPFKGTSLAEIDAANKSIANGINPNDFNAVNPTDIKAITGGTSTRER